MCKFNLAVVCLFSVVSADFSKLKHLFRKHKKLQHDNGTDLLFRDLSTSTSAMGFGQQVNGYGCWCYFGTDVGKGKATPVDALDHLCQKVHHAYLRGFEQLVTSTII